MKKVTSAALALALSAGSLGAIDFASKEGKTIFGNLDVGIGAAHYGISGKDWGASSTNGYLALDGTLFIKSRVQVGLRFAIGAGNMSLDKNLLGVYGISERKGTSGYSDINLKLGANVASKSSPLFVNILYGAQGFGGNEDKTMFLESSWIGLGLERVGKSAAWELGVLGTAPHYMTPQNKDLRDAAISDNKLGLGLHASLKLMRDFGQSVGAFVKFSGKYMDLPSAKHDKNGVSVEFPKTNHYVGMVEVGLSFF